MAEPIVASPEVDAPTQRRNRAQPVPAPWLDCANCGWRHYPSQDSGTWILVTVCSSCRKPLRRQAPLAG